MEVNIDMFSFFLVSWTPLTGRMWHTEACAAVHITWRSLLARWKDCCQSRWSTVDGKNLAAVDMVNIPLFYDGFQKHHPNGVFFLPGFLFTINVVSLKQPGWMCLSSSTIIWSTCRSSTIWGPKSSDLAVGVRLQKETIHPLRLIASCQMNVPQNKKNHWPNQSW